MAETPKLQLPELSVSQSQKETTVNETFRKLDALVQANAIDKDLTSPPGSPSDGNTYIVASGATGDWSGQDLAVAYFQNGAWIFLFPTEGWLVYVQDENSLYLFNGSAWVVFSGGGGGDDGVYDVGGSFIGKPTSSQIIFRIPFVRSIDYADDFSGSRASARVAATGSTAFVINRNGSSIGTMTYGAGQTTATFATTGGAESFVAGDVLTVEGPASPDATLTDPAFLLVGLKV